MKRRVTIWMMVICQILTMIYGSSAYGESEKMDSFEKLAAGGAHAAALRSNGTVWSWGANYCGQLGVETDAHEQVSTHSKAQPIQVPNLNNVSAIATGQGHSAALKHDGTVWCWGYNAFGQLGTEDTDNRTSPGRVEGLSGVIAIAAGSYHSVALKNDGTVWAWGNNESGQLGDGSCGDGDFNTIDNICTKPVQVQNLSDVIKVAAGENHTVALKKDGSVWVWGLDLYGQENSNDNVYKSSPVQVKSLEGILDITAGDGFTIALKNDHTVWCWGSNASGQLGNGTYDAASQPVCVQSLNDIKTICAGKNHALALSGNGMVWAWGDNSFGELGSGSGINSTKPVRISQLNNMIDVGAGDSYSVALDNKHKIWTWGANNFSQLGVRKIVGGEIGQMVDNVIVYRLDQPVVSINGNMKEIDPGRRTTPLLIQDRTFLPIRSLVEIMGGTVTWVDHSEKILIHIQSRNIQLQVGSCQTVVNGVTEGMDVAPCIVDGRTMIPLRYMMESIGCDVAWNAQTNEISVFY